jgi:hypothetical protein
MNVGESSARFQGGEPPIQFGFEFGQTQTFVHGSQPKFRTLKIEYHG